MSPGFLSSIRWTVLWILPNPPLYPYVTITLYGSAFQQVKVPELGSQGSPQHHISDDFHRQIQFALCRVQSLLLAASQLVSFPSGTKTFQFPEFAAR